MGQQSAQCYSVAIDYYRIYRVPLFYNIEIIMFIAKKILIIKICAVLVALKNIL